MNKYKKPRTVIIVGGSIGGLMHALAILSLPDPPKVTILERSPTTILHNQGAGLVAGNETQEFFDKYIHPGREIACTASCRFYLDSDGSVLPGSVEHRAQRMTSWDMVYRFLRWRVDGLESKYVQGQKSDDRPKAIYANGCTVTRIEDRGAEGVELTWNSKDKGPDQSAIADLVIAADGASSTIRRILAPEVQRKYVGYIGWRGMVPETELSQRTKDDLIEKFAFYHTTGVQVLGYIVPGIDGAIEPGERMFNWMWYENHDPGSPELEEIMTDDKGRRHEITLPMGAVRNSVWEKQIGLAAERLPPQFAEAIAKTRQPFVQAITDSISDRCSFMDGKVFLVGDALAGFRPHTARGTSQAAFDAMAVARLLKGDIDLVKYEDEVLDFAKNGVEYGVFLGQRSQFGTHPWAR